MHADDSPAVYIDVHLVAHRRLRARAFSDDLESLERRTFGSDEIDEPRRRIDNGEGSSACTKVSLAFGPISC